MNKENIANIFKKFYQVYEVLGDLSALSLCPLSVIYQSPSDTFPDDTREQHNCVITHNFSCYF